MTLLFIRLFFIAGAALIGYQTTANQPFGLAGALLGGFFGLVIIFLEIGMCRVSLRGLSRAVFGLILGVIMSKLFSNLCFTIIY